MMKFKKFELILGAFLFGVLLFTPFFSNAILVDDGFGTLHPQESFARCISDWYGPLTTWSWAGFQRSAIHQFGVEASTGTSGGQLKVYDLPLSTDYGEVTNKKVYQVKTDLASPFVAFVSMNVFDKGVNINFDEDWDTSFTPPLQVFFCVARNYFGSVSAVAQVSSVGKTFASIGTSYGSSANLNKLSGLEIEGNYEYIQSTNSSSKQLTIGGSPSPIRIYNEYLGQFVPIVLNESSLSVSRTIYPFILITDSAGRGKGIYASPFGEGLSYVDNSTLDPRGAYSQSSNVNIDKVSSITSSSPLVEEHTSTPDNASDSFYYTGLSSLPSGSLMGELMPVTGKREVRIFGNLPVASSLLPWGLYRVTKSWPDGSATSFYRGNINELEFYLYEPTTENISTLKTALSNLSTGDNVYLIEPISASASYIFPSTLSGYIDTHYLPAGSDLSDDLTDWAFQVPIQLKSRSVTQDEINTIVNQTDFSCEVDVSPIESQTGGLVEWAVKICPLDGGECVFPGAGYSVIWSGTDGLSGSNSLLYKKYDVFGSKIGQAEVTKIGGGKVNCQNQTQILEDLGAVCYATPQLVETGSSVKWISIPSGGTSPYVYDWDSDGYDDPASITETYSTAGPRSKTLKVRDSVGRLGEAVCSVNVSVPLTASCTKSPTSSTLPVGSQVIFSASATGGDGVYSYNWSGTDGLVGTGKTSSIIYRTGGDKNAIITVSSGGRSVSANCPITTITGGSDEIFDYTLSNGGDVTVNQGESVSNSLNARLVSGHSRLVNLSLNTGNSSITGLIEKGNVIPTEATSLSLQTLLTTPTGTYPITATGNTALPVTYYCKSLTSPVIGGDGTKVNYSVSCRPNSTFNPADYLNDTNYSSTGVFNYQDFVAESNFFNSVRNSMAEKVCGLGDDWTLNGTGFSCSDLVSNVKRTTSFNLIVGNEPIKCGDPVNLRSESALCSTDTTPAATVLKWDPVPSAKSYNLSINGGTNMILDGNTNTSYNLPASALSSGGLGMFSVQAVCPQNSSNVKNYYFRIPGKIYSRSSPLSGTPGSTFTFNGWSEYSLGGQAPYSYSWTGDVTKSYTTISSNPIPSSATQVVKTFGTKGVYTGVFNVRDATGAVCSAPTTIQVIEGYDCALTNSGDRAISAGENASVKIVKRKTAGDTDESVKIYPASFTSSNGVVGTGALSSATLVNSGTSVNIGFTSGLNPEVLTETGTANILAFNTTSATPAGDYTVNVLGDKCGSTTFKITVEKIKTVPGISTANSYRFCENGRANLDFTDLSSSGAISYRLYEVGKTGAVVLDNSNTTDLGSYLRYVVSGTPDTTKTYQVSAVYPNGESEKSASKTINFYTGCSCDASPTIVPSTYSSVRFNARTGTVPSDIFRYSWVFPQTGQTFSERILNYVYPTVSIWGDFIGQATIKSAVTGETYLTSCKVVVNNTPPIPTTIKDNGATCRNSGDGVIELGVTKQNYVTGYNIYGNFPFVGATILNKLEKVSEDSNYVNYKDTGLDWNGGVIDPNKTYEYAVATLKGTVLSAISSPWVRAYPSSCLASYSSISGNSMVSYNTNNELTFNSSAVDYCDYKLDGQDINPAISESVISGDRSLYKNITGVYTTSNFSSDVNHLAQQVCFREENSENKETTKSTFNFCVLPEEPNLILTPGPEGSNSIHISWQETHLFTEVPVLKRDDQEIGYTCAYGVCQTNDTNLNPGQTYAYKLTMENSCGTVFDSGTATVKDLTTTTCPSVELKINGFDADDPAAPVILTVGSPIYLSWITNTSNDGCSVNKGSTIPGFSGSKDCAINTDYFETITEQIPAGDYFSTLNITNGNCTRADSAYVRFTENIVSDFDLDVEPQIIYLRTIGSAEGKNVSSEPAEVSIIVGSGTTGTVSLSASLDRNNNLAKFEFGQTSINLSDNYKSTNLKISSLNSSNPIPVGVYGLTVTGTVSGIDPKTKTIKLIVENVSPGFTEE